MKQTFSSMFAYVALSFFPLLFSENRNGTPMNTISAAAAADAWDEWSGSKTTTAAAASTRGQSAVWDVSFFFYVIANQLDFCSFLFQRSQMICLVQHKITKHKLMNRWIDRKVTWKFDIDMCVRIVHFSFFVRYLCHIIVQLAIDLEGHMIIGVSIKLWFSLALKWPTLFEWNEC